MSAKVDPWGLLNNVLGSPPVSATHAGKAPGRRPKAMRSMSTVAGILALAAASAMASMPVYAQTGHAPDIYTLHGSRNIEFAGGPGELAAAAKPSIAGVVDLARAWRRALEHDHAYRAAISEQAAAQTERSQGRAGLLPQVQAGYSRSQVNGTVGQPNFRGNRITSDVKYDSANAYVQLQQPLLNYGRYADYRRGGARANQGAAVFAVKQQETGIRLARAYFNALLAYDDVQLQRSLTDSLKGQAQELERRYERNEGTRTDVQETKARLAVARANVIDAEDQLNIASRELEALLGAPVDRIAGLDPSFGLLSLVPAGLDAWLERALVNNADVRAAREAVNVARAEVDRANARYLPTMELVASYGNADSENLSTLSQRSNTFVIGIQVNIPIFTGGYNTANVSRARLDQRRLEQELRAAQERMQAEVTRQYTNVMGGGERIRALETAVESGQLSLDSARKSALYGASSNLDVLKVQDLLYKSRYELIKAKLEYLLARLQLASAAGDLHAGQFEELSNAYLEQDVSLNPVH